MYLLLDHWKIGRIATLSSDDTQGQIGLQTTLTLWVPWRMQAIAGLRPWTEPLLLGPPCRINNEMTTLGPAGFTLTDQSFSYSETATSSSDSLFTALAVSVGSGGGGP